MLKSMQSARLKVNRTAISAFCTTKETKPDSTTSDVTKLTDVTSKSELSKMEQDIKDMKWRTPWHEKEGQYYSFLRTFYTEHNNTSLMKLIQSPIDLSPTSIKKWWAHRKERKNIAMQQYVPARNQMLGDELAAAHFVVHRGGSVKFFGDNFWIKANQFNQYELPKRYEPERILQAIDCSGMELYYEGLANMRDLQRIEWFSVRGCENMDDWCMDRITNIFARTLLYLDVRDCPDITFRGVGAVAKMQKLKILYVDNMTLSDEFEMTCLLLQEANPHLDIRAE